MNKILRLVTTACLGVILTGCLWFGSDDLSGKAAKGLLHGAKVVLYGLDEKTGQWVKEDRVGKYDSKLKVNSALITKEDGSFKLNLKTFESDTSAVTDSARSRHSKLSLPGYLEISGGSLPDNKPFSGKLYAVVEKEGKVNVTIFTSLEFNKFMAASTALQNRFVNKSIDFSTLKSEMVKLYKTERDYTEKVLKASNLLGGTYGIDKMNGDVTKSKFELAQQIFLAMNSIDETGVFDVSTLKLEDALKPITEQVLDRAIDRAAKNINKSSSATKNDVSDYKSIATTGVNIKPKAMENLYTKLTVTSDGNASSVENSTGSVKVSVGATPIQDVTITVSAFDYDPTQPGSDHKKPVASTGAVSEVYINGQKATGLTGQLNSYTLKTTDSNSPAIQGVYKVLPTKTSLAQKDVTVSIEVYTPTKANAVSSAKYDIHFYSSLAHPITGLSSVFILNQDNRSSVSTPTDADFGSDPNSIISHVPEFVADFDASSSLNLTEDSYANLGPGEYNIPQSSIDMLTGFRTNIPYSLTKTKIGFVPGYKYLLAEPTIFTNMDAATATFLNNLKLEVYFGDTPTAEAPSDADALFVFSDDSGATKKSKLIYNFKTAAKAASTFVATETLNPMFVLRPEGIADAEHGYDLTVVYKAGTTSGSGTPGYLYFFFPSISSAQGDKISTSSTDFAGKDFFGNTFTPVPGGVSLPKVLDTNGIDVSLSKFAVYHGAKLFEYTAIPNNNMDTYNENIDRTLNNANPQAPILNFTGAGKNLTLTYDAKYRQLVYKNFHSKVYSSTYGGTAKKYLVLKMLEKNVNIEKDAWDANNRVGSAPNYSSLLSLLDKTNHRVGIPFTYVPYNQATALVSDIGFAGSKPLEYAVNGDTIYSGSTYSNSSITAQSPVFKVGSAPEIHYLVAAPLTTLGSPLVAFRSKYDGTLTRMMNIKGVQDSTNAISGRDFAGLPVGNMYIEAGTYNADTGKFTVETDLKKFSLYAFDDSTDAMTKSNYATKFSAKMSGGINNNVITEALFTNHFLATTQASSNTPALNSATFLGSDKYSLSLKDGRLSAANNVYMLAQVQGGVEATSGGTTNISYNDLKDVVYGHRNAILSFRVTYKVYGSLIETGSGGTGTVGYNSVGKNYYTIKRVFFFPIASN